MPSVTPSVSVLDVTVSILFASPFYIYWNTSGQELTDALDGSHRTGRLKDEDIQSHYHKYGHPLQSCHYILHF